MGFRGQLSRGMGERLEAWQGRLYIQRRCIPLVPIGFVSNSNMIVDIALLVAQARSTLDISPMARSMDKEGICTYGLGKHLFQIILLLTSMFGYTFSFFCSQRATQQRSGLGRTSPTSCDLTRAAMLEPDRTQTCTVSGQLKD